MFLAYVSPLGRALVDKGLYLPESWTSDPGRCAAAPKEQLPLEDGVGWRCWSTSQGQVGCRSDAFGMSSGRDWRLRGCGTCWTLVAPPSGLWSLWTNPEYQGFGRPRKPKLRDGQRRTMEQAVMNCRRRPGGNHAAPRTYAGHQEVRWSHLAMHGSEPRCPTFQLQRTWAVPSGLRD